jgi:hypothetical protein
VSEVRLERGARVIERVAVPGAAVGFVPYGGVGRLELVVSDRSEQGGVIVGSIRTALTTGNTTPAQRAAVLRHVLGLTTAWGQARVVRVLNESYYGLTPFHAQMIHQAARAALA